MIITEFYEGQGLGNQLWVYAACRSISEHLGEPFCILGQARFKGAKFLRLDYGHPPPESDVALATTFREEMYYDPDLGFLACSFDGRVKELGTGNVRIEGLFQSEEYFFEDVTRVERYLTFQPEDRLPPTPDDVCILNIRGGEYKRHKRFVLPRSYWVAAMHNMAARTGVGRFAVVTDDPRYAATLFPELPVVQGGISNCYYALHTAKHVIVSNSTFSYFPLKTGRPDRTVIAPKLWGRFGNVHGRWASPANLYSGWLWQDATDALHSYEECLPGRDETARYYRNEYFVRTAPHVVQNEGLKRYIPRSFRAMAKRGLSVLLPRHFG